MKKITSLIALLLISVMLFSACAPATETNAEKPADSPAQTNSAAAETAPEAEQTPAETPDTAESDAAETHIVTDALGREVELPNNDKVTAVVSNAYNMELVNAIGAIDQVVGVDWYIWQDAESWKGRFTEDMNVGKDPEMNYEKIIELNPDVLILAENGGWEDAEQALSPFGIQVFVSNAYFTADFLETTLKLGEVLGHQEEAQTLYDYFSEKLDYINTQLADVEKKTVYFEYRKIGRTTIPGDYYFNMIEFAHGDNVFRDAEAKDVDPEAVVEANPAYIVKVSAPDVTSSYYPPTLEDHQAIKEELISRPGWDEIDAVKNDNILLLSHYVQGGASKLVGTMYVAKFLYPDLLPDLHPEQIFSDWLTMFQHNDYIEGHTYPAFSLED